MMDSALEQGLIALAQQVGELLLTYYAERDRLAVQQKEDQSPVTAADLASHQALLKGLQSLTPAWPVLSEEGDAAAASALGERWWLIDPLDGTREFVAGTGQFCINLALIDAGEPILGVIEDPLRGMTYLGGRDCPPYRIDRQGVRQPLSGTRSPQGTRLLLSPREPEQTFQRWAVQAPAIHQPVTRHACGSALKFAYLAAGEGEAYLRSRPCSQWDTAAGQALLSALGGGVFDGEGRPLRYGPERGWLNPPFVALAVPIEHWHWLLKAL